MGYSGCKKKDEFDEQKGVRVTAQWSSAFRGSDGDKAERLVKYTRTTT